MATSGDHRRTVAGLLILGLVLAIGPAAGAAPEGETRSYINPVSHGVFDAFPDPAIIRAKDGYWWAYGTTDPVRQSADEDNTFHLLPMARSSDLVNWEYMGDVFTEDNRPTWHPPAGYWAPDVRYLDGTYYLYYSVAGGGIGVATAPTPGGPWTDSGGPVVDPEACPTGDIDPAQFTDEDGTRYLYWGSGAICVAELNADGTRIVGEVTRLVRGFAEAPWVVRHGEYYYLFYSEGGCCAGAMSGYQVRVGRSTNPRGPFVDREGVSLTESRWGGTFVLSANGNTWVGPGHHAITTDLSGQPWFVYHAIDKNNPWLEPPVDNINRRPLLIDRLDWIDGWPTVRAGEWASDAREPAPVTRSTVGGDFNDDAVLEGNWRAEGAAPEGWTRGSEEDAGGYVRQSTATDPESYLVSERRIAGDVRAEADLRLPADTSGAAGLALAYRGPDDHVVAWLDAGEHALVTDVRVRGESRGTRRTSLPEGFRFDLWHNVAVELRGRELSVEVTDARQDDPLARQRRTLPAETAPAGSVGVAARGAEAEADNVHATRLHRPVPQPAPEPRVGTLDPAYSDEFEGEELSPEWSWVRTPAGTLTDGVLEWPTQSADLHLNQNSASVLHREAPDGNYMVEAKLDIDLGVDTDRSFSQAGLVAYADDDEYIKLVHVAIGTSRRTEYAKETGGAYGGMMVGPPADTTWLRIQHRVDPANGEREFRAATSRDGRTWTWGGVWSLPLESRTQIGLVSQGGAGATARFDYVRTYRD